MRKVLLAAPIALFALASATVALEDRKLDLPDYKAGFTNYMISDRLNQDDQVISLWANDTARTSARADGTLPDGSVLIGEIYAAKKDADGDVIESAIGRRVPGALKAIVLMERKAAWGDQYSEDMKVGGWEFEVFSPAGENLSKDTTACRECHAPLGDSEFTWTLDHIAAAN